MKIIKALNIINMKFLHYAIFNSLLLIQYSNSSCLHSLCKVQLLYITTLLCFNVISEYLMISDMISYYLSILKLLYSIHQWKNKAPILEVTLWIHTVVCRCMGRHEHNYWDFIMFIFSGMKYSTIFIVFQYVHLPHSI